MLPSKLKRKNGEAKATSNGKGVTKKEEKVEAQSDYESDEVSFVILKHVLLFTSLRILLGELPDRDSRS